MRYWLQVQLNSGKLKHIVLCVDANSTCGDSKMATPSPKLFKWLVQGLRFVALCVAATAVARDLQSQMGKKRGTKEPLQRHQQMSSLWKTPLARSSQVLTFEKKSHHDSSQSLQYINSCLGFGC